MKPLETEQVLHYPTVLTNYIRNLVIDGNAVNSVVIKAGTKVGSDDGVDFLEFTSDETVTMPGTVGQPNSLDTGSEDSNTWYYIWAIKKPSTGDVKGLFSESTASPTLPAGYTRKRLIGAVYNAGFNFPLSLQYGREVFYEEDRQIVSGAVSTTWYSPAFDLSVGIVPSLICNLARVHGVVAMPTTGADSNLKTLPGAQTPGGPGSSGVSRIYGEVYTTSWFNDTNWLQPLVGGEFNAYQTNQASISTVLSCTGYILDI